jgi:hypothetical protein
VLEPLDLMARLAALVPPPRMHLTRFHGVFAPHSKLRSAVTPAHRGVGGKAVPVDPDKPLTPRHVAMIWAQRLKRVFSIEIDSCGRCGGKLKVIASIEEPEVIARLLSGRGDSGRGGGRPAARQIGSSKSGAATGAGRLPEAPEGGVQAALCGKHRQGRWFESTIRYLVSWGFRIVAVMMALTLRPAERSHDAAVAA